MNPHPHSHPYVDMDWGSVADWFGVGAGLLSAIAEVVGAVAAFLALIGAAVSIFFGSRSIRLASQANNITALAYRDDVKQREESQARLVYSVASTTRQVHAGEVVYSGPDVKMSTWEHGLFDQGSFASLDGGNSQITAAATGYMTTVTIHNRSQEIVGPFRVSLYGRSDGSDLGGIAVSDDTPILPGESLSVTIGILASSGSAPLKPMLRFRDSSGRWWQRRGYDPLEPYTKAAF